MAECEYVELRRNDDDWRQSLTIEDGFAIVVNSTGSGIAWNEEEIGCFAAWQLFEEGRTSDTTRSQPNNPFEAVHRREHFARYSLVDISDHALFGLPHIGDGKTTSRIVRRKSFHSSSVVFRIPATV